MIPNPEFKGEWKPKMIENPAYKGKWVAPDIDNPEFVADDALYAHKDLKYLGFELWQVSHGWAGGGGGRCMACAPSLHLRGARARCG